MKNFYKTENAEVREKLVPSQKVSASKKHGCCLSAQVCQSVSYLLAEQEIGSSYVFDRQIDDFTPVAQKFLK